MKLIPTWVKQATLLTGLGLSMAFTSMASHAELQKTYNLTETDSQIIKFDKVLN